MQQFFEALRFLEHLGVQRLFIIPCHNVFQTGICDNEDASLFDRVYRSVSGRYMLLKNY